MTDDNDSGGAFDTTIFAGTYGDFDIGQARNIGAFLLHPGLAQMLLEKVEGEPLLTFTRRGDRGSVDDELIMDPSEVADDARKLRLRGYADGFVLISEDIEPSDDVVERHLPADHTAQDVVGNTLYRWTDIQNIPFLVSRLFTGPGNWVVTEASDEMRGWLDDLFEWTEAGPDEPAPLDGVSYDTGADAAYGIRDFVGADPQRALEAGAHELLRWRTLAGEEYRLTLELSDKGNPFLYLHARRPDATSNSDSSDTWQLVGEVGGGVAEFVQAAGTGPGRNSLAGGQ